MKKKIGICIMAVIILVGIIMTCIIGLNFDLIYSTNKQVDIYIGKEFNNEDISKIVKEVIGNNQKVIIKKVELYNDMVSIVTKDLSDEQIEQLNTKINEKYELKNSIDDLIITSNSNVRGRDLIKQYVWPIIISEILILIFVGLYTSICSKQFKRTILNVLKMLGTTIITALFCFSVVAITRIPVNRLTIPTFIIIYIVVSELIFCKIYKESKVVKEINNK